jgi:hypothetical protein
MLMRPGTTVVTALSPPCELRKAGSGLNTIAIHGGLASRRRVALFFAIVRH